MNPSRAAVIVVGVHLVAVWAAAAAGGRAGAPGDEAPAPQAVAALSVGEASSSLAAAAARLEAHARSPRARPAAVRDPFHFAGRTAEDPREAPGRAGAPGGIDDEAAAVRPAEPPEPDVVLAGMAETLEGETVVRTAIIKAAGELVLAGLGDSVGGRYEVVGLTADAVELEDAVSRERRTCRLK